jgi:hypothetical protein
MKIVITTLAVAALLAGAGVAQAQNTSTQADVKADTSMNAPKHKHMARSHHRYHRHTTGIGSENNASAPGTRLPGKDRLNSKGYLENH